MQQKWNLQLIRTYIYMLFMLFILSLIFLKNVCPLDIRKYYLKLTKMFAFPERSSIHANAKSKAVILIFWYTNPIAIKPRELTVALNMISLSRTRHSRFNSPFWSIDSERVQLWCTAGKELDASAFIIVVNPKEAITNSSTVLQFIFVFYFIFMNARFYSNSNYQHTFTKTSINYFSLTFLLYYYVLLFNIIVLVDIQFVIGKTLYISLFLHFRSIKHSRLFLFETKTTFYYNFYFFPQKKPIQKL